jgi:formate--tetrahydrofolate ligase
MIKTWCEARGAHYAENQGFAKGGEGAADLAKKVVEVIEKYPSKPIQHTYNLDDSIQEKLNKIVVNVYGGTGAVLNDQAKKDLKEIDKLGAGNWPVCIAKTQFSFTDDAKKMGSASGHTITIRQLIPNAGAGFVVAVAGEIMRMPGLPKEPAAMGMDIQGDTIVGLS